MNSTTTNEMRSGSGPAVSVDPRQEQESPATQASLIDELTAQTWLEAGLRPGMRVLAAGCRIGELCVLASAAVGPKGSVVGVDPSTDVIRSAALRTTGAGSSRLSFTRQELHRLELGAPVDALLVRSALLRLDDPCAALRGLVRSVKPGGLIVAQEIGESMVPIAETIFDRLGLAPAGSPAELRIAIKLSRIFKAAGLPPARFAFGSEVASRHLREAAARHVFVSAATRV